MGRIRSGRVASRLAIGMLAAVAMQSWASGATSPPPARPGATVSRIGGEPIAPESGTSTLSQLHSRVIDVRTGSQTSIAAALAARTRPVVLGFWSLHCGPCRAEIPDLKQWAADSAGEVDYVGIAFHLSRKRQRLLDHVVSENLPGAQYQAEDLAVMNGVFGREVPIPSFAIFDATGALVDSFTGSIHQSVRMKRLCDAVETARSRIPPGSPVGARLEPPPERK